MTSSPLTEIAWAKINLALHIRRRREDGYHELETLFAFVDGGDVLTGSRARADSLTIGGAFGAALAGSSNILLDALGPLARGQHWRLHLDKRLPVAAGLGGGSADAGALFRLVEREQGLPEGWEAIAARLGADVPACIASRSIFGRGTGTELAPGPEDLAGCPVLLVNPRLALATGPVFRGWDGIDRGPLPDGSARAIALHGRNDLEAPAIALCPEIGVVLAALRAGAPWLARMSGSGASCFALYDDVTRRDEAAAMIAARHPAWWQMTGALR